MITSLTRETDWQSKFMRLGSNGMTEVFTSTIFDILSTNIPNKTIKCNDKDPPWITPNLKAAIKRQHRILRKYKDRDRKLENWNIVKRVRNETSKLIAKAKENYFLTLGRKLSDPSQDVKAYWKILNRVLNKKKTLSIPPLLENGTLVTNMEKQADILNDYFAQHCSTITNSSTLPNFQSTCNALLHSIAIDPERVTKLIHALGITKSHGYDDISISMIKICDAAIVEPLCLSFKKSLETGVYSST